MSTINWTDIFLALIGLASDVVTSHKEISLAKLASEEISKKEHPAVISGAFFHKLPISSPENIFSESQPLL